MNKEQKNLKILNLKILNLKLLKLNLLNLKVFRKMLILSVLMAGLWAGAWAWAITAYAAEFTLTNDNVNIRAEASRNSTSVGSVNRGDTFTIEGEVTDSDNNTWYRVRVSGDTFGYIRSDLGRVSGNINEGSALEADPIPHREATISQSSVRVRSGPSTSHGEVTSIQRGTALILTGEASDSSGNTWYQIKATIDGQEINGFVRSDMVTPGDFIEMEEVYDGEPDYQEEGNDGAAETETSPSAGQLNFEIRYIQNDVGGYDYFLYDRLQGTQWKVEEFLELINVAETNERLYSDQSDRQKMIIIILAILIIVLALVLTVLIFKVRDLHEDAEIFYPDSDAGQRARGSAGKKAARPGDARPLATARPSATGNQKAKRPQGEASDRNAPPNRRGNENPRPRPNRAEQPRRTEENSELKAAERDNREKRPERERPEASRRSTQSGVKAPLEAKQPEAKTLNENKILDEKTSNPARPANEKAAPARKAQNFLTDDDEFEFEFLNIDE
ncbi:MAG: SH3 domain-containing protein [Lachnospiraceae bacterium]|nr:SH3 domain-containing protein [Lachnospiraceae bacterium]